MDFFAVATYTPTLEVLGSLAAVVMALGYGLYALFLLTHRTRANGTSWVLMCVSATTFLIVEYLYGVPWNALKLGAVDAAVAFFITGLAYSVGRIQPWSPHDKKLVCWYLFLLVAYLIGDGWLRGNESTHTFSLLVSVIVILLYNATTVIEFIPIIRDTWTHNQYEVPWPWLIWTLSYILYFYVRVLEHVDTVNLVYPLLSIVLHGSVAILTIPPVWRYLTRNRTI